MSIQERLINWLIGKSEKPVEKTVEQPVPEVREIPVDKVKAFNSLAPKLFSKRLSDFGYYLDSVYANPSKNFLSSSVHNYLNKELRLLINIEQAPYYTDYGFSIFLYNMENQNTVLLCNVESEYQDPDCNFLIKLSDRFFADPSVLSVLRGEKWEKINPLGLEV